MMNTDNYNYIEFHIYKCRLRLLSLYCLLHNPIYLELDHYFGKIWHLILQRPNMLTKAYIVNGDCQVDTYNTYTRD